MYLSKKLVASIIAVIAIAGGASAFASLPDGAGVVHGCYDKASGQLRVTDPNTNTPKGCSTKEAALNWNQQGPQGPAGPAGITGLHQVYDTSPEWTTGGIHSLTVSCPAGERALGIGYGVLSHFWLYGAVEDGSDAVRIDSVGSFNPAAGGYGNVLVTVDGTKLDDTHPGVSVNLTLTCAKVAA
jgi:hypothetical protein